MSGDQSLRLAEWMKSISAHPPSAGEGGEADRLP